MCDQMVAGSAWMSCTAIPRPAASLPEAVWTCFITGLPSDRVARSAAVSSGTGGAPVYGASTPWCGWGLEASAASAAGIHRRSRAVDIASSNPSVAQPLQGLGQISVQRGAVALGVGLDVQERAEQPGLLGEERPRLRVLAGEGVPPGSEGG